MGTLHQTKQSVKALAAMLVLIFILTAFTLSCPPAAPPAAPSEPPPPTVPPKIEVKLPEPRYDSDISVEKALLKRRSVRDYKDEPLTLREVSQLLWSAQGITDPRGLRTAPSAGATYPLETYLVVGNVKDLAKGIYRYDPWKHKLVKVLDKDVTAELTVAALGQPWVKAAAINIVFTAIYERTTRRYGDRGIRYVHMEVGHAAQNIYLQAEALDLGTVVIGAFYDDHVRKIFNLPKDEHPLYIIPVGRRK